MRAGKGERTGKLVSRVAELRSRRGITAADLARAAGVSRQAIYSIESGTYLPNTAVALRVARFLDARVEDLFVESHPEDLPGNWIKADLIAAETEAYEGQPVELCRVGDQCIAVPVAGDGDSIAAADGVVRKAPALGRMGLLVEAAGEPGDMGLLVAGCDPAMPLLRGPLLEAGVGFVPWSINSAGGLQLLRQRRAHIAGCHMRDPHAGTSNLEFVRQSLAGEEVAVLSFVEWEQGLAVVRGNPKHIRSVADLARPDVSIANRESGSGARRLLDALLAAEGVDTAAVQGYATGFGSHLRAARQVAAGRADCCISVRLAARLLQLDFVPLVMERYDLVIPRPYLRHPPVARFLDTLADGAVRRRLRAICGYDLSGAGIESGD